MENIWTFGFKTFMEVSPKVAGLLFIHLFFYSFIYLLFNVDITQNKNTPIKVAKPEILYLLITTLQKNNNERMPAFTLKITIEILTKEQNDFLIFV